MDIWLVHQGKLYRLTGWTDIWFCVKSKKGYTKRTIMRNQSISKFYLTRIIYSDNITKVRNLNFAYSMVLVIFKIAVLWTRQKMWKKRKKKYFGMYFYSYIPVTLQYISITIRIILYSDRLFIESIFVSMSTIFKVFRQFMKHRLLRLVGTAFDSKVVFIRRMRQKN